MSAVVPATESARRFDIDLSDGPRAIGPFLEAAFGEAAVTEMAPTIPDGMAVADDGQGFEPERRALTPGSGMGVLCMEERARLLDGTVRVESAPGQEKVVHATLPVPEDRR